MDRAQMVERILERLEASDVAAQWAKLPPGIATRHAVIEELLPAEVARAIYEAFPKDADGFVTRKSFREFKRTSVNLDRFPPILADITYASQHPSVVARIGELTGMKQLEGDPSLYAGGLSMMFKAEFLNPHIDNSHEVTKSKYRRMNLLYYVAPDWVETNGGNLELWDDGVRQPFTITSKFNRLVLMETNKRSWHSVSPITADAVRCCVSNYYFSDLSPDGSDYYHVTSFTGRPEQKARRLLGIVDNAARQVARRSLGMTRATDAGYEGDLRDDRAKEKSPAD